MKIIADCGATKSEWMIIHSDSSASQLTAGGINASTMSAEVIQKTISEICERISVTEPSAAEIHLYMAGIPSEELKDAIHQAFALHMDVTSIEIQSDLLGAARAACGHQPGIAAILGTGSNSCLYDGNDIVKRIYSGGFILGDEGSAATLGKIFISDFLKGLVPAEISTEFSSLYPTDYSTIVTNVYRSESSPSGYLGNFAPFIMKHYDHPYIKELVDNNFRNFFRRSLKQYGTDLHVGIVGGFGFVCQDIISRIASEEGISISRFIKTPIEGLLNYHNH